MIELFSANTPNGKKITIMLEEIKFEYKVTKIDINKGEQFKSKFKKISPFNKIPVIRDHNNNQTIFESGAILIYLAELSGKYYETKNRFIIFMINNYWYFTKGTNLFKIFFELLPIININFSKLVFIFNFFKHNTNFFSIRSIS